MLDNEVSFFDSERNTHLEARVNFPVPRIGEVVSFNYLKKIPFTNQEVKSNSFSGTVVAIERIYDDRDGFVEHEIVEVYLNLD